MSNLIDVISPNNIVWIAAGCGGTLLFILILGVLGCCVLYVYKRNVRRQRGKLYLHALEHWH